MIGATAMPHIGSAAHNIGPHTTLTFSQLDAARFEQLGQILGPRSHALEMVRVAGRRDDTGRSRKIEPYKIANDVVYGPFIVKKEIWFDTDDFQHTSSRKRRKTTTRAAAADDDE